MLYLCPYYDILSPMKIIHVDMDQFFAAVEQHDQPELRGMPIAVGHDAERGVVSTASYEARRFGVHSAQSIQLAKRLCPQLIIVEPHFQRYKEVSAQLRAIFHDYNHDGMADIFTYGLAGIAVYRNISQDSLAFELLTDQLTAY